MDNVLRGRVTGWDAGVATVDCGSFALRAAAAAPVDGEVWACFRGERVLLGGGGVSATIRSVQAGLPLERVELDAGLRVIARVQGGAPRGGGVTFTVPPAAVHLVPAAG